MVGLGLGSKSSPARESRPSIPFPAPPPYKEDGDIPPIVLAETTTTTTEIVTTTTQTTTHFFSLPLWSRRRAAAPVSESPSRRTASGMVPDEHGIIRSTTTGPLLLEKDLPPTPDEADLFSSREQAPVRSIISDRPEPSQERSFLPPHSTPIPKSQPTADLSSSSIPTISLPPSQPAYALAQAGLGIGLPHVMPSASTPSDSELSSVTFVPLPPPPLDSRRSLAGMRRVKSSQKITASSSEDAVRRDGVNLMERRARGLSLGASALLHFNSDSKGKEKEAGGNVAHPMPSTVTRKSSFWSRKKSEPPVPPIPPTSQRSQQPLLPSVLPVSPFTMGMRISSPTPPSLQLSPVSLSRSRSERASSSSPVTTPRDASSDVSHHKIVSKRSALQRPATADASSRSRARSFLLDASHSFVSSPSPTSTTFSPRQDSPRPSTSSASSRPRAQTNPPLLHRLSVNLFASTPPVSNSNGGFGPSLNSSPIGSATNSPRPSLHKHSTEIPKPQTDAESPELYLNRLVVAVSKAEIAGVLASSGDPFYSRALRAYIDQFNFFNDPLDVALRKLLMDVGLPRETQQIDRVIEAFASRYLHCNPSLFTSDDHPYVLAFSLIMLHTDAFNKSNKRKMTKPDYIKNTRLPGVAPEVLDCFYDNIVFAPFIFIEDPLDINGQRGMLLENTARKPSTFGNSSTSAMNGGGSILGKAGKIDPYYLITNNLLDPLRVNVEIYIPRENPYLHEGTAGPWDEEEIRLTFAKPAVIEVVTADQNRMPTPFFGLSVGGVPSPLLNNMGGHPGIVSPVRECLTLRVTKVGLLNRKEDMLEGGKKASNRKWKTWSVILTGSQLLLFRDPAWATALLANSQTPGAQVIIPQVSMFKPDEFLSVKDAIAVFDKSYSKYENALRLALPDGRQILFQATEEKDLNEWISRINYASAFKTAGVRMRASGMSGRDLQLMGVAAATSHLHDKQTARHSGSSKLHSWEGYPSHDHVDFFPGAPASFTKQSNGGFPVTRSIDGSVDSVPVSPEIEGAHEFKVTFDQVKAELAAGHWTSSETSCAVSDRLPLHTQNPEFVVESPICVPSELSSQLPSRCRIIQSKVHDLEAKIAAAQTQLDSDMRFVRNVATLTPFQRTTRDRLQLAVQNISKRIMQVRLEISKLVCHRNILSNDLVAEERDRFMAKKTALKAATDVLQRDTNISRMTISVPTDDADNSQLTLPRDNDPSSHRTPSSIADSFHSALDFGPEWHVSSDDLTSSDFFSSSRIFESPEINTSSPDTDANTSSRTHSLFSLDRVKRTSSGTLSSPVDGDEHHHERFFTAPDIPEEQAEEWNKTRAAKRVSLVRMPSDLRLSSKLGRSTRQESSRTHTVVEEASCPI